MAYSWQSSLKQRPLNGRPIKIHDLPTQPVYSSHLERPPRWHTRSSKAFVTIAVLLLLVSWRDIIISSCSYLLAPAIPRIEDENPIWNKTLGFQKLFVLSIPDRSDRRAPLLAGANATNLTITVLDAIRDKQIAIADRPEGWGNDGWTPKEGELGCLMSHLRAWRKVIQENITSALIMESDVDWDMRIKQTMVGVGRGTKAIADWPFEPEPSAQPSDSPRHPKAVSIPQSSPYGDKWDLIWLGHCGSAAKGDGRVYTFNDSSAPSEDHVWVFGAHPAEGHRKPGTRIVYHLQETVCTTAYAISNRGARKFEEVFREANTPIDMKMWDACANNPDLACVGIFPQIISMTESRANIKHSEGGLPFGHEITEERVVAGKSIQVSSRVNADLGLADKGPERWKWEWKGEDKGEEEAKKEDETKGESPEEGKEAE